MTPEEILNVEHEIVLTLKNIYVDPEGVANIRMTLTAPNCPMADMLLEDIDTQVRKIKGVKSVNIVLTFDPVWDKSMMSEEALLELNML